ncbi:Pvc16 family protein [Almyronema epifaneia]|uniref:Pvc16 family protein n=1 Tax=Almyronema epifaneia S1 TaxID=2991925 RepID=A0ABW6ID98_9CYAN
MIPAVAQTLAEVLTSRTSLISKEQIYFNHPQVNQDACPAVSLYCYHIQPGGRESAAQSSLAEFEGGLYQWLDLLFLISVSDFTALGEQRLLSEILLLFLDCPYLPEEALTSQLRGRASMPIQVSTKSVLDAITLWKALGVPLRPAVHLTVTVPLGQRSPISYSASQAIAEVTPRPGSPLPEPLILVP